METLNISSRMPHFRLVSKVATVSSVHMAAEATLADAPAYVGLEIMAQTAALHVRQMVDFARHAFLLSVQHCALPSIAVLKGCYRVKAVLRQQSSDAFGYHVNASGPDGYHCECELLIGTRAYDNRFPKSELTAHYRHIWAGLKGD